MRRGTVGWVLLWWLVAYALSATLPIAGRSYCPPHPTAMARAAVTLGLDARERRRLADFDREYGPLNWPAGQLAELRGVLSDAGDQGLDPARYHADALNASEAAYRDLSATAMALRYAHDMVMGQVDLAALFNNVDVPRPKVDLAGQLALSVVNHRVGSWLAGLRPPDPEYAKLLGALAAYRDKMSKDGQMAPIPRGRTLRQGDNDPRVALVKARLRADGDLTDDDSTPILDAATSRAVISFQRRHGLTPDGLVGRKTIAALNVPLGERVAQILVNLERRRYFGHVLPPTRIEVNVAAATVTLFRGWRAILTMRAVVGDRLHHSPILVSPAVWSIVLNPPWVVPLSIMEREILPRLAYDPDYLAANHMHWVGDHLVQSPGPDNSLGLIKFDFPNRFSVYLHDTPARALFALSDRALSHGCVRLEKPRELLRALLKENREWPPDRVARAIIGGSTVRIALDHGPPVVFAYWTVFIDDDGTVEFRKDIYHRDARLIAWFQKNRAAAAEKKITPEKIGCPTRHG